MTNYIGSDSQDLAIRLQASGITVLSGTIPSLQAIKQAFNHRDFIKQDLNKPLPFQTNVNKDKWIKRLQIAEPLDELESLELLQDYHLTAQRLRIATSLHKAIIAAQEIGYPVVLKTAMLEISHKSDVKGVKLNLATDQEVKEAYDDLANHLGDRVQVAGMEKGEVEVAFGYIRNPQFGPLVLIASGGIFIEIFNDKQIAMAPFGKNETLKMITHLKINPLLKGIRGTDICDKQALAQALSNFSILACDLGEFIMEMDVNPVKESANGCVAVDAMIVHL